jgi:tetratricopeptide (TPR) repeat protein
VDKAPGARLGGVSRPPVRGPKGQPSRKRIRLFRLISATVIPAAFFVLLELVLRVAGFGYDTRYFIPAAPAAAGPAGPTGPQAGELEANQRFAWRFYPPTGAKAPLPVRLTVAKPADHVRIFIFGGSAAMGSPDAAYGFGRILEVMLAERYPARKFDVIVTAMEGMNSHVSRVIADEAAELQPDLFVVYMGNNEVVGPYGASDVFGGYTSSLGVIRASLWLKSTRTGQLAWRIIAALSGRGSQVFKGMESFAGAAVRADDPRLGATYENFAGNLAAIRDAATRAGAKAIVCTVASNLRDCPPFISSRRTQLSDADRARFDELCAAGRAKTSAGDCQAAMEQFSQAASIDADSANLEYWMGQCHLAAGQADKAREHLIRSRDLDALRVRADTKINDVLRQAGKRYDGFVDFEKILAADGLSREGLPGAELLLDHVHFTFAGNCRLAAAVMPEVQRLLAGMLGTASSPDASRASASGAAAAPAGTLDEKHLAQVLAMTGWDRYRIAEILSAQMAAAPFTNQFDAAARLAAQRSEVERLRMFTLPEVRPAILAQYLNALAARPDDIMLRANYATCLYGLGDSPAAAQEWTELLQRMPGNAQYEKELGVTLMQQGKLPEASSHFRAALAVMPHDLDAMNNLGASLLWQDRLDEAGDCFHEVLRANADHADARANLGITLARKNDLAGAVREFQAVLGRNPSHVGALRNLSRLLMHQGRLDEAIDCYGKALAAREDYALHVDLGQLLDARRKSDEAMKHFARAAEMAPNVAAAQLALGGALLKTGRYADAADRFERAIAIDDRLAEAHRDLGTALAKLDRPDRAITELGRAVDLSPGDFVARQRLAFALLAALRLPEAIEQYKKLLEVQPNLPEAHNNLAVALAKTNKPDDAIIHFAAAVQLEPTALRHYNLASQLVRRGADREAVTHFRHALRLRPDWPAPMAECAWVLATADDDKLRSAEEALNLAGKACELTGWKEPDIVDALAAAQAEAGQFGQAAMTAQKARLLAMQRGDIAQAGRIDKRIDLYKAGKPCRRGAREIK